MSTALRNIAARLLEATPERRALLICLLSMSTAAVARMCIPLMPLEREPSFVRTWHYGDVTSRVVPRFIQEARGKPFTGIINRSVHLDGEAQGSQRLEQIVSQAAAADTTLRPFMPLSASNNFSTTTRNYPEIVANVVFQMCGVIVVAGALASIVIAYLWLKSSKSVRSRRGLCPACQYPRVAEADCCPECGRLYDDLQMQ